MSSVVVLVSQILVMFLLVGVGFWLYRSGRIGDVGSRDLGNVLVYVVLPAVIVNGFRVPRTQQNVEGLLASTAVAALAMLLCLAISRACFRDDPIGSFAAAFSNPGFFGIPLIIALLGQEATFFEAAYIGFLNVLQFTYGVALMTGSTDSVRPLAVLKAPFVAAIAVGLALFCLDLSLPPVLDRALGFLTGLNTPLAMFSVGVYLAQADLGQMLARPSLLKVSLVRLVAIPLALVLVLWAIPGSWHDMELAVLIACACPVGSNVAVYAQLHGKDYRYAAQTVVVSALLSIVTIPALVWLAETIW